MRLGSWMSSVVVAGLVFGCGGSGSSYMTASSGGGGTPPTPGPSSAVVSIADYSFTPDTVTVKVGTTVTWTNVGGVAHTSTADGGAWDSGQLASPTSGGGGHGGGGGSAGGTYTTTFGATGTFTYHCANHPTTMKGAVVVTP